MCTRSIPATISRAVASRLCECEYSRLRNGSGSSANRKNAGRLDNSRTASGFLSRNAATRTRMSVPNADRERKPSASLAPTLTNMTSAGCSSASSRKRRTTSRAFAPFAPTARHSTPRPVCASNRRARLPGNASSCVAAPTPAAVESPSTSNRNGSGPATAPNHGLAASGKRGVSRRSRRACAMSNGALGTAASRVNLGALATNQL